MDLIANDRDILDALPNSLDSRAVAKLQAGRLRRAGNLDNRVAACVTAVPSGAALVATCISSGAEALAARCPSRHARANQPPRGRQDAFVCVGGAEKILIFRRQGREARPVYFDRSGPVYQISDRVENFSGIIFMHIIADEILHLRVDIWRCPLSSRRP